MTLWASISFPGHLLTCKASYPALYPACYAWAPKAPQHELYPDQLPCLASCVQRAVILLRLLRGMKSEVKAQLPCLCSFCQVSKKFKLTHTFWKCSVGPGPLLVSVLALVPLVGPLLPITCGTRCISTAYPLAVILLKDGRYSHLLSLKWTWR